MFFGYFYFLCNQHSISSFAPHFAYEFWLVCHLVSFFLSFFLDVRIQSCHFVVRWSRERKVRKYSLKREMKVSRWDCLHPFSNVLYEVSFVYRKPNKMTNLAVFIYEIIKIEKLGAKTLRNDRCLFHYSCKISWK